MFGSIFAALMVLPLLLGPALFVVLRNERQRQVLQTRLKAMTSTAVAEPAPSLLLRRPNGAGKPRGAGFFAALQTRLDDALAATGNRIGVSHLAIAGLLSAAGLLLFLLGLLAADLLPALALSAATGLAGTLLLLRMAQRRYQSRFLELFPDALDLIGRAVKAGLPVLDSMEVATQAIPAPVGSEFRRTLDEARIGVEVVEALRHAAERVRVPEFRFFVVALALQHRTGGSLAETLANLSNVLRRRKELRLKVRAFTAESRMSVFVLSLLPFVAGALMYLIAPDLMVSLVTDPRGRFMIGVAVVSLLTGSAVMTYMIKKSLR